MNKKIKILIVGLVLLVGNTVKADPLPWNDFVAKVTGSNYESINVGDFWLTMY